MQGFENFGGQMPQMPPPLVARLLRSTDLACLRALSGIRFAAADRCNHDAQPFDAAIVIWRPENCAPPVTPL